MVVCLNGTGDVTATNTVPHAYMQHVCHAACWRPLCAPSFCACLHAQSSACMSIQGGLAQAQSVCEVCRACFVLVQPVGVITTFQLTAFCSATSSAQLRACGPCSLSRTFFGFTPPRGLHTALALLAAITCLRPCWVCVLGASVCRTVLGPPQHVL